MRDPILQRAARQQFHGDDGHAVEFFRGKHEHRSLVPDRCGNLAFAEEARSLFTSEARAGAELSGRSRRPVGRWVAS